MPVFKVPTINDPIELRLEIGLRGPEQANFRGMFEVHDRKTEPSAVEIVSMDPGDDHLVYEFLREDGTSAVNGEGLIAVKREETILVRMHEDPKSPFGDESVDIEVTVGLAPDNNIITLNQESDNLTSRFKRPSWWAENWSKFLWGIPASLLLLILVALWAARVNRRREEEEDAAFYEAQKPQLNGTVTWKGKGYALSGEEPIDVGKLEFRLDTDGNICVRPESDFMVQYDDEEALGLQEVEFLGNVTTQLPNAARVKFYENDPDEDEEDGEGGDGHYMYIRGHISTLAVEEGA